MWQTVSECICGASHAALGKPCEDYVATKNLGERLLIAACDGVGSASHGGLGAKFVARSLIYSAQRLLPGNVPLGEWRDRIGLCFQLARNALNAHAAAREIPFEALASTAILAIATPRFVACGHIGDGACVALEASGDFVAVSLPDHGAAIHESRFVTDQDFPQNLRFRGFCGEVAGVAVLTDGLEAEALVQLKTPHPPFFGPLFRWLSDSPPAAAAERVRTFLISSELRARTADDLTLVLAMPKRGDHAKALP